MANAILIDTETNSLDNGEPIEVAWADWNFADVDVVHVKRFRPHRPIDAGAALVHGILPCDLEGDDVEPSSMAPAFVRASDYWIGHGIDFDAEVMGNTTVKRVCTLALARMVWPQFKCHKLGAIIYEIRGMTAKTRQLLSGAHCASADVELLGVVLGTIVNELECTSLNMLWLMSEESRIPITIGFGKHSGEKIKDLPRDYVHWLLKQEWLDQYLRKALV